MTAQIKSFFHAATHTCSHVVSDPATGIAAIIDPVLHYDAASARTSTIFAQATVDHVSQLGLQVQWLLETHAHADHLSAAQWLKQIYPEARLCIGEGIRRVQQTFASVLDLGAGFTADGAQFDHLFVDGETFAMGPLQARVIAVPGHTSDSNAYLIGDALFTGDSLFMPDGGTARCDFPGGMQPLCSVQYDDCLNCPTPPVSSSAMTTALVGVQSHMKPPLANNAHVISTCMTAWKKRNSSTHAMRVMRPWACRH